MAKTYAIVTDLGCVVVTDNTAKNIGLPGAFLLESFGIVAATGHGNADGVASVVAFPVGLASGFADGTASVSGIGARAWTAHADGAASVAGVSATIIVRTGHGNADGIASVAAQSLVAAVVGNADGIAAVSADPLAISAMQGNADGFASVIGAVKIPGDGCALMVGI